MNLDELLALDETRLLRAQGKLTYLGVQTEPVTTVTFSVYTTPPRLESFRLARHPEFDYGNDDLPAVTVFTVVHDAFRAFLHDLSEIPAARAGGLQGDWTSLMIMADNSSQDVFEVVMDRETMGIVLAKMVTRFGATSDVARIVLEDFAQGA